MIFGIKTTILSEKYQNTGQLDIAQLKLLSFSVDMLNYKT